MRVIAILMVVGFVRVASAEIAVEPPPDGAAIPVPEPASTYPVRYIDRPLVLPTKMLAIHGVMRINLTADSVGSPIWIAPSAYYGLLPKLQVGIVHDPGLCFLGDRDFLGATIDECPAERIYNDFALDGLYQLVDKPEKHATLAGHATFGASNFDPVFMYLRVGALGRYAFAKQVALIADWGLRLGLSNRDKGNKEAFDLPLQLAIQATDNFVLFVEAGLIAPLSNLADTYYASIGLAGLYAVSSTLDVGARFEFPRIAGGTATGSNATKDIRQLDLFVTYRR
jgi:hypothetical protein